MASPRSNKIPQKDRIVQLLNDTSEPVPLLNFLIQKFPEMKRTGLKTFLKHGHIKVNDEITTQFNDPITPGTGIQVNLTRPFVKFSHPRIQIVYEDDDLIVINKGYGLLSVGTGNQKKEDTAYEILKNYVKSINHTNKIFVIHRLDRGTSGLMMFAKNIDAQQRLQHNWNNMVLSRKYVAVLEGIPEKKEGEICSNLAETSQFEVYETEDSFNGKPAITRFKILSIGNGRSLAEFSLETGRKNQIRVHAKSIGHPIVGDKKYGASSSPIHRLALHARTLRFVHPITRKDMNFEIPVPKKFISLVKS